MTFALFFGNRGFFPESLIGSARKEIKEAVEKQGHKTIMMDIDATKYGAVETAQDGVKYANFLKENAGRFDGVILSLPNFGDENGAVTALLECGVPILVQAYPDRIGKMGFADRRDAFCGKISVMDVFTQYGLPFTAFAPHVVDPLTDRFCEHIEQFAAVCNVVKGMKKFTVGAIGARTTAFKTVRFDELTLQKYKITTEALDLSEVFMRFEDVRENSDKYINKAAVLKDYTNWTKVPDEKYKNLVKLGVVLDDIIEEYAMDSIALRCWIELEKKIGVSPCVLLSEINDRGITAACELDVCNAVSMRALALASQKAATCLDWNNNYGDDDNKCILFHCGPVPQSLMTKKGEVIDHPMFAKSFGEGCGWGCNVGRIAKSPFTFSSSKTENGKLVFYLGEGEFTGDEIEVGFFGCAGVVKIDDLQSKLLSIGKKGYRHHVGVTFGNVMIPVKEAFETYLGYEITQI